MFPDFIFIVLSVGISMLAHHFNWIYLRVSPITIVSICLAGIRLSER